LKKKHQNSERLASNALNSSYKINNEISNKYLRLEALKKQEQRLYEFIKQKNEIRSR
jgi:hypothetical protein